MTKIKKNTNHLFKHLSALLIGVFVVGCGGNYAPLETVDKVDLERYLGKWYEIARLPASFQEGCHCTTAEYELIDSTTVSVLNSCRSDSVDGEIDQAEGKAFIVENSNNTKLKVQFFWPFKGDYWIIALDQESYNYAMVGTPSRKYLWILSREPELADSTFSMLLDLAQKKRFDTGKLIVTDQSCYQ